MIGQENQKLNAALSQSGFDNTQSTTSRDIGLCLERIPRIPRLLRWQRSICTVSLEMISSKGQRINRLLPKTRMVIHQCISLFQTIRWLLLSGYKSGYLQTLRSKSFIL